MSIFYVDGDETIDFTKVCGTKKSYSDHSKGIVVYLEGGHTIPIASSQLDSFRVAYQNYRNNADFLRTTEICVEEPEPILWPLHGQPPIKK